MLVGDAYQLSPVKARGGMFEQLCADLPWSQRLGEVWRMADPEERDTSLALRAAHGNRLRTAIKWYRDNGRLHSGDPIAMAADALDAYLTDRAAGKDALLVCDTWEMADALNRRLHDTLAMAGPTLTAARDQPVSVGRHHHEPKKRHHHRRAPSPDGQPATASTKYATEPVARRRTRCGHQPHCGRTTIRQRACGIRRRLPQTARHTGLCDDRAFGPRSHRRQLPRDPRRGRIAGDALCRDDPRTPQQRSIPLPKDRPTRPTTSTPNRRLAKPSTLRAEATNTQPHTTSGRSSPTTTDPAPCTPKLNALSATCFPTWSPNSYNANRATAVAGGREVARRPIMASRPPNEPPPLISMPVDWNCDPTLGATRTRCNCAVHGRVNVTEASF